MKTWKKWPEVRQLLETCGGAMPSFRIVLEKKKTVAFRWIVANGMGCKEVFVRIELLEEV